MMNTKCAVIMAGGRGTRLRPYTMVLPKPLVPVGEFPIMEIVIRQLVRDHFDRIIIAVNHQAELIETYFGDGRKYGVNIEYSLESKPLSTMGPLKLIEELPDNFIVMNSDILTDLNYADLLKEHIESGNIFTISAYNRTQNVEYGVLYEKNGLLERFQEKPKLNYLVSMGVYVAAKEVLDFIPEDTYFGFDDLMKALLKRQEKIGVIKYKGYWLDIGRPDDYQIATDEFENLKGDFLK